MIVTGIRHPHRVLLLLLREQAVLFTHPWASRPPTVEAPTIEVIGRAHFDAFSASRFIIMPEGNISLVQLMTPDSVGVLACLSTQHHSHYIVTLGPHGRLTLLAVLISDFAILGSFNHSKLAPILLHLVLSVFAGK